MTATAELLAQTERLRRQTLDLLSQMEEHGRQWELPPFPDLLQLCRQKLQENIYRVLVVGEAKRGKSSFINALLGRDLLPVDVDVATCQVFRIRRTAQEAYRLRFEDNSEQVIRAEDLPRYGSQVLADLGEVPRLDQIIRWIEVDVPAPFLPPNLWLLDTPGLGSVYAFHAQITYRFVPQCDGVVYVLDSHAPISQPELNFVEDLLKVTNHLFFVQTKIDLFDQDAWQKILQRNEDILRQRFGNKLGRVRVWPVSNQLLRKASETNDQDYLEASKYPQLQEGLQTFLYRVAGLYRTVATVAQADEHHSSCQSLLEQRLDNLKATSEQKQIQLREELQQRRRQFEKEWGVNGSKRKDLVRHIRSICSEWYEHIVTNLEDYYNRCRAEINGLSTLPSIQEYSKELSSRMSDTAMRVCKEAIEQCQNQLAASFQEFGRAAVHLSRPVVAVGSFSERSQNWWTLVSESLRSAVGGGLTGMGLAGLWALQGATGILSAISGILAAPFLLFGGLGAAIAFLWRFITKRSEEVAMAKQQLLERLGEAYGKLTRYLFDCPGTIRQAFERIKENAEQHLESLYYQGIQQNQAEIERLERDARLEEESRKKRIQQVDAQLTDWKNIGKEIQAVKTELEKLHQALGQ